MRLYSASLSFGTGTTNPSTYWGMGYFSLEVRMLVVFEIGYFFASASARVFRSARPFSKVGPSILSQFMNRPTALKMKLFFPDIPHVTAVPSASDLKVK